MMRTPVLDHVIITEHSYFSFKHSGLLSELEANLKYVLPYELEKMFYEEMQAGIKEVEEKSKKEIEESLKRGLELGRKEGKQEGLEKTAKQMLSKGLDIKLICEMTGLSIERVQQLQP